ncbi:MAG TPA: DinB family protein [Thermomicrobiaceae bacterium]|nr:DinB family protein [Thermomicrobiaceae bacterium]
MRSESTVSLPPSPSKTDLLAALRASGDETLATLSVLPEEVLARGRYEGGWTGREIVAHLASVEWTYPRLIDLARQAVERPVEAAGPSSPAPSGGGIDAYNARQVARRADVPVAGLLEEFARNREATIAAMEAVDDALLAVPVRTAAGLEGPLGSILRFVAIDHVRGHLRDVTAGA